MRRRVPFVAVLRSEWTKLRSVRSTWWCTGMYLLVVAGTGWLVAATTDSSSRADVAVATALTGFGFGQLVLIVLGALTVTSEFTSGSAVGTLTAVPRRTRLLVAKTLVVAVWCALLTAVVAAVCFLAARTLIAVPGGIPWSDPDVLRALVLQVVGAALVGVLAVALGAVVRSTAGAVGLAAALVFALPPILAVVGGEIASRASQALPALRVGEAPFLAVATTWPVGMGVAGAWAVACWVLGAILLERRDV